MVERVCASEGERRGRQQLQVLLALVFGPTPLSPTPAPTLSRNSLGVSQINFQVAPCSKQHPKWLNVG